MQYLKYLKFIPLVIQLVQFIREAETLFSASGSGTEKRAMVAAKFKEMVKAFASFGLIDPKMADTVSGIAEGLITAIVDLWNAFGGVKKLPPEQVVTLSIAA